MTTYDLILLAIILVMTVHGAWRGIAWQVASLLSYVTSGYMATRYCEQLAPWLSREAPWNVFLAMLVLFVATSAAVWIGFQLLAGVINRLKLQPLDRQVGGLFGLVKGVALCLLITFFAVMLSPAARLAVTKSRSAVLIARLVERTRPLLPEKVRGTWGRYLDELQRNLQPPGNVAPNVAPEWPERGPPNGFQIRRTDAPSDVPPNPSLPWPVDAQPGPGVGHARTSVGENGAWTGPHRSVAAGAGAVGGRRAAVSGGSAVRRKRAVFPRRFSGSHFGLPSGPAARETAQSLPPVFPGISGSPTEHKKHYRTFQGA